MRTRFEGILAALAVVAMAAPPAQADTPVAETASPCVYAADTRPSPRAITTAAELGAITTGTKASSWRQGETVTLTAPDGTAATLANSGTTTWSGALPFNAGGLWTAENSRQGAASFTVRHSFFGTLGDGTAASPAKLVDADELVDYAAGDGYVFTLAMDEETLLGALQIPAGFGLERADDGAWRLVSSPDGLVFASGDTTAYPADSRGPGPDRRLRKRDTWSVAYSCDNWTRSFETASSLTVTTPSGAATAYEPAGTGVIPVRFNEAGDWTVALVAGGRTLAATISVKEIGTVFVVR